MKLLHQLACLSRCHEGHVLVLVDDRSGDVGVQDVEAEGEDAKLDEAVVALRFLRGPPAHDAKRNVEDGRQALRVGNRFIL